jgi:bifunctional non-homologous end joining protein LigD
VAEVEFREWTRGGSLRQPSYKGLREDKAPEEVVREDRRPEEERDDERRGDERGEEERKERTQRARPARLSLHEQSPKTAVAVVEGHELRLSNRDKVLYPESGFTKGDVIDYYAAAAAVLTGHLEGRPLTVKRWPDGVEGGSFFQKQAPAHRPEWVQTVTVPSGRKPIDYVLANDAATLVWLANLAALELHAPLARAEAIERPTVLVFDLDPGEPATIVECCHVALALQGMFEQLGLESFAKTSGSKGLQVYVPLNSSGLTFADTKPFAKAVAELLERAEPELVVSRMTKARRTGRVLIDWSQNDRRKTTVCVYSLRAGPRPTVSAPVSWDEVRAALRNADPASLVFDAGAVLERLADRGDEFAPVLSLTQRLPAL